MGGRQVEQRRRGGAALRAGPANARGLSPLTVGLYRAQASGSRRALEQAGAEGQQLKAAAAAVAVVAVAAAFPCAATAAPLRRPRRHPAGRSQCCAAAGAAGAVPAGASERAVNTGP